METRPTMFYFAYGSNMLRERLFARVGDATQLGRARLGGYRLAFCKRSVDGSGKCTILREDGRHGVWGVVFELTPVQKRALDGFEGPGYAVEEVALDSPLGTLHAFTYVGHRHSLDAALRPYTWYKRLVLAGAAEADLPAHYIARIRRVSCARDRDAARAKIHIEIVRSSARAPRRQ